MTDFEQIEVSKMLEMATLVQVGKSMLECLASGSVSSHKVQKLRDPVSSICQLLLAVEKDVVSESWVREVSKALYEASELVEEAVADGAASSLVSKVRCFRSLFGLSRSSNTGTSIIGVRIGPVINRLCQKLSQLIQEAPNTGVSGSGLTDGHVPLITEPLPRVTTLEYNMDNIVGREEEKEQIVNMLLDTSDVNKHISVVSIVGMGGIGKTTLAKSVYDDERITNHFDLKSWVFVSNEFDMKKFLTSIISSCSADSSKINDFDVNKLKDLLKTEISGKIFFLVLDDVWNESLESWLELRSLLMVGARGSKILVISRSGKVTKIIQSDYTYDLHGLSEEKFWSLFKNLLFGQLEFPDYLKPLGQEILSKCEGLPLAVKVLAHFLRGKTVEVWRQIAKSTLWDSPNNSKLLPALRSTYYHLPSPLKVCLAYCSLFPQGHEISISDLLSLWMAQGYIEPEHSLDLEDSAVRIFQEFLAHNLFQAPAMDDIGNIASCRMHDLVHDLATHAARGWVTMTHLSCFHGRDTTCLCNNCLEDERKLLSFLHLRLVDEDGPAGWLSINNIVGMSNFKSLRVLDLHAFGLRVLPDSIGNLVHLRYLDFSHNEALIKLPNSIANLYHLQTLKLNFCYELEELPTTFGKLVCLRRLEIDGCERLTCMPPGFENLSSLRTLPRFVIGRHHYQFASGLEALFNLTHLRGRLMIELSENWTIAAKEARKSKLSNKYRLTELEVKWGPTRHTSKTNADQYQLLLDGLQPPIGLEVLKIEGYKGNDFPSWARGNTLSTALPNLITVSIEGCGQCKTLPPFSCLQNLKRLSLRFMDDVQFFESSDNLSSTSESPFFPSLQELTLHGFYSLERWWKYETRIVSASFSCLQKLKIWSCPKLTSMPLFPKVEVLDMQNINEKLLEIHRAWVTRPELQTPTDPSSSHSEISNFEPTEHPQSLQDLTTVQIKSCPRVKTLALLTSSRKLKKLVL